MEQTFITGLKLRALPIQREDQRAQVDRLVFGFAEALNGNLRARQEVRPAPARRSAHHPSGSAAA